VGYITGMTHVLDANCLDRSYRGKFAATTETIGQTIRAFILWTDEHPELWGEPMAFAMAAISTKLPCRRS
jgi:hypothetical protein